MAKKVSPTPSSTPKANSHQGPLPTAKELKEDFLRHVIQTRGRAQNAATPVDHFHSLAGAVRDPLYQRWARSWDERTADHPRRVYYMSMEYLLGRALRDTLLNLGIADEMDDAMKEMGLSVTDLAEHERDAGLGNGGLGRLAACFIDSMATLDIPSIGYGIRYDYGIFRQDIVGGRQVEQPDNWLRYGNPWEQARPERLYVVQFGGRVLHYPGQGGRTVHEWVDAHQVYAMAYDMPVPGYRNDVVNTLRLWSAVATRAFDISYFNRGDYIRAIAESADTENISRVLYPNDQTLAGKELRLKQEYFLVSATLQDTLRRHVDEGSSPKTFNAKAVLQMNDTHPALAVAELMRLLMDQHGLTWEEAWDVTKDALAYTNHTVLPEALEKWPVWMFEKLLPRHLQIIYEVNIRFMEEVQAKFPGDDDRLRRMSIIEEWPEKQVRMAHLALVGSRRVNGVSALHTDILKAEVFRDFHEMWPKKIVNQTNGITPRRWLLNCNPTLSDLITSRIGDGWVRDLEQLRKLEAFVDDKAFRAEWQQSKAANKKHLATYLKQRCGVEVNPNMMFDTQVKRIHEYKRQSLNLISIAATYLRLRSGKTEGAVPTTFFIGGKAAPGYETAKLLIELACGISSTIAADPKVRELLQLVFVPNYGVSLAEAIIPGSDVSEQLSTAGMEASGTGNMKFALNGALTIGTWDGANIEIGESVGKENIFLFGATAEQVEQRRRGGYDPRQIYYSDEELRGALDAIASGLFSPHDPNRFRGVVDAMVNHGDFYMVLEDFRSYVRTRETLEKTYRDQDAWTRMAILNVARMGMFSSDRTIMGYARDVWDVEPSMPLVRK